MEEIYSNISEQFRQRVDFIFQMSLLQKNHMASAQTLINFLKTCINDDERDYANLVFYTKMMERLNDESNNN